MKAKLLENSLKWRRSLLRGKNKTIEKIKTLVEKMKTLVGTRDVSEGLAFGKFSEVEYVLSATDPSR